ncbi:MAG TPA: class I SAM-dependent methyltransferase [Candidatus Micrarchaeaceae archaeon]|nr:class I SAM-dependent methyltransferase [Candidatus Micrarchaeaceae archaeon]
MERAERRWRFKGPEMEGMVARWYTGIRSSGKQLEEYRQQATRLTAALPDGARILEVAPGPGYLAVEMARSGRFRVSGLDISRTFVEIASVKAAQAGVNADFHQGDAATMPFESGTFDLVTCQAAFKNFTQPGNALAEFHRVLRNGGTAVIEDMSSDASHDDIASEVRKMQLGRVSAFMTKVTLEMLKRRAYSPARFQRLVAKSPFQSSTIRTEGIGLEVRLVKRETA